MAKFFWYMGNGECVLSNFDNGGRFCSRPMAIKLCGADMVKDAEHYVQRSAESGVLRQHGIPWREQLNLVDVPPVVVLEPPPSDDPRPRPCYTVQRGLFDTKEG